MYVLFSVLNILPVSLFQFPETLFRLPARYFQFLLGIRSRFNLRTKDPRLVVNLSRANKQESRLVQRNKDKAAGEDLTKYDKKISVTSL